MIISGFIMVLLFFICYVLSFVSRGRQVYIWICAQILISTTMIVVFDYVYFSIFLAFFIGNIQKRAGFFTFYTIHLVTMVIAINYGFFTQNKVLISQFPFVLLSLIGVILLPVSNYNRNKREKLEVQLEDANKRISELVKLEERQRIARDLHDTIGQKLALIGLKSDLAGKLMRKDLDQAQIEIREVHQTARTALKEVRELVTEMRGTRLEEEIFRVRQILKAAGIEFILIGDPKLDNTSLMTENVLSMCLKEAVTNVVKHSDASSCTVTIEPSRTELTIRVEDDGVGIPAPESLVRGNGLKGMKERLEFVNGSLEIVSVQGTAIIMRTPNVAAGPRQEAKS